MTLQLTTGSTGSTGSTGWLGAPAHGAEILVSSSADLIATDGDCTLREAIFAANQNTPQDGCAAGDDDDDRIVFQPCSTGSPWKGTRQTWEEGSTSRARGF